MDTSKSIKKNKKKTFTTFVGGFIFSTVPWTVLCSITVGVVRQPRPIIALESTMHCRYNQVNINLARYELSLWSKISFIKKIIENLIEKCCDWNPFSASKERKQ